MKTFLPVGFVCAVVHPARQTPVMVKCPDKGYWEVDPKYDGRTADEINSALGVTDAEREAAYVGSLFGWDVPGADPKLYETTTRPASTH